MKKFITVIVEVNLYSNIAFWLRYGFGMNESKTKLTIQAFGVNQK